jgi:hypothetical protein
MLTVCVCARARVCVRAMCGFDHRAQSRLCVNRATAGDYEMVSKIGNFVNELYAGFQLLNLKNDFLRKKCVAHLRSVPHARAHTMLTTRLPCALWTTRHQVRFDQVRPEEDRGGDLRSQHPRPHQVSRRRCLCSRVEHGRVNPMSLHSSTLSAECTRLQPLCLYNTVPPAPFLVVCVRRVCVVCRVSCVCFFFFFLTISFGASPTLQH